MSQNEVEQIEITIAEARKIVEKGRLAQKLAANPTFKKIVMDGYFVEEASRLTMLYSEPTLPDNIRAAVERDLNGPGAFKRYLSTLVRMGEQAEQEIRDGEQTLEEIREEEFVSSDTEE